MNVDRNELEALDRESLVTRARNLGVERAEVLTRLEIIDEILSSSIPDEQERRVARGLLGRARDLVARVVEKGLNLPDAALRLRTMAPPAAAWRRGPRAPGWWWRRHAAAAGSPSPTASGRRRRAAPSAAASNGSATRCRC